MAQGFKPCKFSLNGLDPVVKLYIRNLEKEITKLQSENTKLELSNLRYKNKVKDMEKEIKKLIADKCPQIEIYLPEKNKLEPPLEE